MKILFTSVGRRVELVQAFCDAAKRLGTELMIIGADITDTAPALAFCNEKVKTPRISDPDYIPFLKEYCEKNGIDALIPTIDTDLMCLAENRDSFGKTKVIVSSPSAVSKCRDKRLTAEYFRSLGLKAPMCVDDVGKYNGTYPAFIKPKDGSSSIFAYKAENERELIQLSSRVPDYVIQPFVEGEEYTVDVFCTESGEPVYITPRLRLAVRAGEVMKTRISQDEKIKAEIRRLVADFRPIGQITVQLIRERSTGDDYYIEINPRFGGGAPLSIKAGADSAEALLRMLSGEKLTYRDNAAEDKATYSRFDQSIRVDL